MRLLLFSFLLFFFSFADPGEDLLNSGNIGEALTYYQQRWSEDPHNNETIQRLKLCTNIMAADGLYRQGRYKEAYDLYRELPVNIVGNRLIKAKQAEQLIRFLEELWETDNYGLFIKGLEELQSLNPNDHRLKEYQLKGELVPRLKEEILSSASSGNINSAQQKLYRLWSLNPQSQSFAEFAAKVEHLIWLRHERAKLKNKASSEDRLRAE